MPQHLQREIDRLKRQILSLSALVEENVQRAVKSVESRDARLAARAVLEDAHIDQMEIEVEEECLKILALYQPVAADLRFLVAVLKINNDLERIGDLAVNIAERAEQLAAQPPIGMPFDFNGMSQKAQNMLNRSLSALVNLDTGTARQVLLGDDEVDEINRQMYDQVQRGILANPDQTPCLIQMLSVSRNLERIADHATNIAEDVIYMIEGAIVRHHAGQTQPDCPQGTPGTA